MTARQMSAVRRHRPRTITRAQETAFAVVLALLGFLFTAFLVSHFDDFRFAFAEWNEGAVEVDVAGEPPAD